MENCQIRTCGVEQEPKAEQVNDKLLLNKDHTFFIVENGKEYLGSWTNIERKITCRSKTGEWYRTYKVISIAAKTATLEYQSRPDLTRTRYRLETK